MVDGGKTRGMSAPVGYIVWGSHNDAHQVPSMPSMY